MPTTRLIGIWLDHAKARVVELQGNDTRQWELESNVERHTHATGGTQMGSRPYMSSPGASERRQDERRHNALTSYYKELMALTSTAERVAIMGPGLAKTEFAKIWREHPRAAKLVAVETSENLTDRQLVAHVRRLYAA